MSTVEQLDRLASAESAIKDSVKRTKRVATFMVAATLGFGVSWGIDGSKTYNRITGFGGLVQASAGAMYANHERRKMKKNCMTIISDHNRGSLPSSTQIVKFERAKKPKGFDEIKASGRTWASNFSSFMGASFLSVSFTPHIESNTQVTGVLLGSVLVDAGHSLLNSGFSRLDEQQEDYLSQLEVPAALQAPSSN
jgi:hypothetical protein